MVPWHVDYFKLRVFGRWQAWERLSDLLLKPITRPSCEKCPPQTGNDGVALSLKGKDDDRWMGLPQLALSQCPLPQGNASVYLPRHSCLLLTVSAPALYLLSVPQNPLHPPLSAFACTVPSAWNMPPPRPPQTLHPAYHYSVFSSGSSVTSSGEFPWPYKPDREPLPVRLESPLFSLHNTHHSLQSCVACFQWKQGSSMESLSKNYQLKVSNWKQFNSLLTSFRDYQGTKLGAHSYTS